MTPSSEEVTHWLAAWSQGDKAALNHLLPLVYTELHRMAQRYMGGENLGHTLQTTALIHEAYLRLIDQNQSPWQNRAHFFGVAAQVMRHILVDYARARHNLKRGGNAEPVSLDEGAAVLSQEPAAELVALDEALEGLAAVDQRKSRVVELRYFGGLSVEETAEVLRVSPITVMRDWSLAKAWLYRALNKEAGNAI
jgi:RNA polymerase sigma factor (TIGR02999 family)